MLPELELETLRILVALERTGSLGAAARELGISQPAASVRVRELEARWQLTLVERSPRGSRLTDDGRVVVAWAHTTLEAVDAMRAGLQSLGSDHRGDLLVASSLTVAEFILPRWLGELCGRRPEVHPNLRVVNSETVLESVRSRRADIGFVETPDVPVDLDRRRVGTDDLVVVVRPDHAWAQVREPLGRDEVGEAAYVTREPGSGTRTTFEHALGTPLRVALEASTTTALIGAVLAGVSPGVVSARAVRPHLDSGSLVAVPHTLRLGRPLTAVWRPGERLSSAADDLLRIAVRDETLAADAFAS